MSLMKTGGIIAAATMLLSLAGGNAQADDASKQKLSDELYEVMNYDRVIDRMADGIDGQIATALRRKYPAIDDKALKTVTEVLHEAFEALVPAMKEFTGQFVESHFSEDDIRNIIAFYRTPTGQKTLDVLPKMTQEMTNFLQPAIRQMQGALVATLNERLRKQGYEL